MLSPTPSEDNVLHFYQLGTTQALVDALYDVTVTGV